MAFEAHVPHLYFEDGNIVLSAQDSENRTRYFRLLAKHLPIFPDMFTVSRTVDKYDGVPVVAMAGDDADELAAFLSMLYNPQDISEILDRRDFPRLLLAPCKLAKKYLVEWIRKLAASKLRKSWPTSAKGWFRLVDDETEIKPSWDDATLQPREFPDLMSSIILAYELCDDNDAAACILPLAFLRLLQVRSLCPTRLPLSPDDSSRLLVARERIGHWLSQRSKSSPWVLTVCGSPEPCQIALLDTWSLITKTAFREGHVLRPWLFNGYNPEVEALCSECKPKVKQMVDTLQNSFVDELDVFFQLNE
ncbi:hypothetical protein C8R45DRAFT_925692 [Mycena sanguinolenta]|nr:hypothetical protein C8R45DRAFT_925692 [Mycena sanguinolenta]